jgi:hypothetical protein
VNLFVMSAERRWSLVVKIVLKQHIVECQEFTKQVQVQEDMVVHLHQVQRVWTWIHKVQDLLTLGSKKNVLLVLQNFQEQAVTIILNARKLHRQNLLIVLWVINGA